MLKKMLILTLLAIAVIAQSERGVTSNSPYENLIPISNSQPDAELDLPLPKTITYTRPANFISTLDSVAVEVVLDPGEYYSVFVDVEAGTLGYSQKKWDIDSAMIEWIESAPEDMQLQLYKNIADLDSYYVPLYVDILAGADPLWLDEIYYCLGNLPVEALELPEMTYLIRENVEMMYHQDSLLNYVEIIDRGTIGGPDHQTVTRYFTIDSGMTEIDTIEISPEMYYMQVMFPKISDEIPGYIDPFTGDAVDPWSGQFWRTFFWSITDTAYVSVSSESVYCWALGDSLTSQNMLWNGLHNTDIGNGALGIVVRWIKDCLVFNSDSERPHQPVRIYGKHMGRCGEHEDITTAACRMALIPCKNVEAISTDHVWNEFYNGYRWCTFEPVNTYVDNQWVYSDGWGKEFGTVYEHNGKGRMIPVTDRYSHEIADVNLLVKDAYNRPIDGGEIMIAVEASGGAIYVDCILVTNSRGEAFDMVGDGKHFYWRVDTEIGYDPEPGYVDNLIAHTMDGSTYNLSKTISASMPHNDWSSVEPTDSPEAYLGARIFPEGEFIKYNGVMDDMTTTYYQWSDDAYGFDMFALTADQYHLFEAGSSFAAIGACERISSGGLEVPVDFVDDYYIVVSNAENVKNCLVGNLYVGLHDSSTSVAENNIPKKLEITSYPNPFNSAVKITAPVSAEIEIFDVNGRIVDNLTVREGSRVFKPNANVKNENSPTNIVWQPSENISSGVYLVRLSIGDESTSKRIVYMK